MADAENLLLDCLRQILGQLDCNSDLAQVRVTLAELDRLDARVTQSKCGSILSKLNH
jgi:hypothetical protein